MELTDNDRQRIEQANTYGPGAFRVAFNDGAEYATIYEREQQAALQTENNIYFQERNEAWKQNAQLEAERSELRNAIKRYFELRESPKVYTREGATEFMDVQKIIHDAIKPCRACEIESNDEQVKQMPEHSCSKGPTREPIKMKASQFEEHEHFVSELSKIQQENSELIKLIGDFWESYRQFNAIPDELENRILNSLKK